MSKSRLKEFPVRGILRKYAKFRLKKGETFESSIGEIFSYANFNKRSVGEDLNLASLKFLGYFRLTDRYFSLNLIDFEKFLVPLYRFEIILKTSYTE